MKCFIIILTGLLSVSVFAITNDYPAMTSPKPETIVLGSRITLEGEQKDLSIEISGVDQPAKIKVGDKTYPATLKYVVDAGLESWDYPPSGWYGWHLEERPAEDVKIKDIDEELRSMGAKLKEAFDYLSKFDSHLSGHYVVNKKILVVQLNNSGIEFLPIGDERYPNVGEVKIKYPEELPFTGIALDSEKAQSRCDNDKPFNAIAVDDNLSSIGKFVDDLGQRGSCFILEAPAKDEGGRNWTPVVGT